MKKNIKLIILLAFLCSQVLYASTNDNLPQTNPRPQKWPAGIWNNITNTLDAAGYSLTQILFDNIDQFDQKIFDSQRFRSKLRLKRTVYDNYDVLNSFSVIDYFRLDVDSKSLSWQTPIFTPNLLLGFSFSAGGATEWTNIRQVKANKYTRLPSIDDEYHGLQNKDPGGVVNQINTYSDSIFIDPSFRPRTNKLWNLITFPFKLPVNLKRLSKMKDGELLSYGVSGYVELGPKIGLSSLPVSGPGTVETGAFYRLFLRGHYKITILKENDRFVRVKITRKKEKGQRWGLGSGALNYELFEGLILFEGQKLEMNLFGVNASFIPFQFRVEKKYVKSFDIGFRYDLKYPKAQEAFKESLFGSFKKSIDLMDSSGDDAQEKMIERLFIKDAFAHHTSINQSLDLKIYKKNVGTRAQSVEAHLTLPDGKHHVFKESKKIQKEWRLIWGRYEKVNYNYIVSLDKTAFLNGKDNSVQLVVEALIEDSHTTGNEMQSYVNKIKKALGQPDILPHMPAYLPAYTRTLYNDGSEKISEHKKMQKARYRKSTFYYGFNINQNQLEKFISTPTDKMWPMLEKAFGVSPGKWSTRAKRIQYRAKNLLSSIANLPLFFANSHLKKGSDVEAARKIWINWKSVHKKYLKDKKKYLATDIDKKIKSLSNVFSTRHYGHELLRLIMIALEDEQLDYFLVATNDAFGRISQRGTVTTNPEYLLNLTDENIGFETVAGGFKSNPDILIKNLTSILNPDGSVKFEFELDHEPQILYLKMFKTNRLQKFHVLAELAFRNKGRFKIGKNSIIVSKDSLDELEYLLGKNLENDNFYSLTLSSTTDGFSWSKVATRRFHYYLESE